MASAPTSFDTFAYAKRLRGVGFTEAQIEAMTTGLHEIAMAQVATKSDLRDLESRLTIKMGVIGSALVGLGVTLNKLL